MALFSSKIANLSLKKLNEHDFDEEKRIRLKTLLQKRSTFKDKMRK